MADRRIVLIEIDALEDLGAAERALGTAGFFIRAKGQSPSDAGDDQRSYLWVLSIDADSSEDARLKAAHAVHATGPNGIIAITLARAYDERELFPYADAQNAETEQARERLESEVPEIAERADATVDEVEQFLDNSMLWGHGIPPLYRLDSTKRGQIENALLAMRVDLS